jgi:hypothetical protein
VLEVGEATLVGCLDPPTTTHPLGRRICAAVIRSSGKTQCALGARNGFEHIQEHEQATRHNNTRCLDNSNTLISAVSLKLEIIAVFVECRQPSDAAHNKKLAGCNHSCPFRCIVAHSRRTGLNFCASSVRLASARVCV